MFREQHIESLVASQEERKKELQQKQEELEEKALRLHAKTRGLTLFAKKLLSFMSADYAKKSGAEAGEDKKIIESSILELASISTKIKNKFQKKVDVRMETDASIIGGIKLRVGNTLIDGSVSNRLQKMRDILIQV